MNDLEGGRRWWVAAGVFAVVFAVGATTCGDWGLTWDEPVYRESQIRAGLWLRELARVRSWAEVERLVDPYTLLYSWVYGRFGLNFHPPMAGLLGIAGYEAFGGWMADIPARRMGSVFTFAAACALVFSAIARRGGMLAGLAAAGSLAAMPRVFADAQLASTDAPGLFFWPAAALAFHRGLADSGGWGFRVGAAVLLGAAFLVKPVSFLVIVPMVVWFAGSRLRPSRIRGWSRADWVDGLTTLGPLLVMTALAYWEIRRLGAALPPPRSTQLGAVALKANFPGFAWAIPAAWWAVREVLRRVFRGSGVWGVSRPGLEAAAAAMALAPLVIVAGNPEWWGDTWIRLAHYHALGVDRREALPVPAVYYLGKSYLYSAPWESGWVWIGATVPLSILAAAVAGVVARCRRSAGDDGMGWYFLLNMAILPMARVFPIPGHDGTRLLLPSFFFVAAFAGWGVAAGAGWIARTWKSGKTKWPTAALGLAVVAPAALETAWIHPYELSYFNAAAGGPRGAWRRGLELSYWYDALGPANLAALNDRLPKDAMVLMVNGTSTPFGYFETLQQLGKIGPGLRFTATNRLEYPWIVLLTADSKADAFSRLLFVMRPEWESRPRGLGGAPVLALHGPKTAQTALALQLMLDVTATEPAVGVGKPLKAESWVDSAPAFLRRWLGRDESDAPALRVNEAILGWAASDPAGFTAAAERLSKPGAARGVEIDPGFDPDATRLLETIRRFDRYRPFSEKVLEGAPGAIVDAARLIVERGKELREVMLRRGYTEPETIGGRLEVPSRGVGAGMR
ncbi:MAG: glycosyltransferase family 39 protein [Isosphaeraceae bacterium]|nr:glycosyltransferase family 39 protein [Isosphaeraceae bacterium]